LKLNYKPSEGMYHYHDGRPHLQNQLADQVQTAKAVCSAYECTGEQKFLELAEELIKIAGRRLYDPEHGGFFDTIVDHNAPGFLSKSAKPLEENSTAALFLTKLFHLTGKEIYRKQAEETLKRFVEIYPQFGFMAAEYAIAVDTFLNEPTTVRILGSPEKPGTKGLLTEAHRVYEPRKIIQVLDPKKDSETIAALGFPNAQQPTAYVCVGTVCTAPIIEPKQIGLEVGRMIAAHPKG